MQTILVAVDGTEKGLQAVSILGRLLKGQSDLKLILLHCVQQVSTLLPGALCPEFEENCGIAAVDQEKVGNLVLEESARRLTEAGFHGEVERRLVMDSLDPAQDILRQADRDNVRSIAVGRRGKSQVEGLLLGSVSSKVAQYGKGKSVWIVDAPVNASGRVMIALEGSPESRELYSYTADLFGSSPGLSYTFLHLMPLVPPQFWDDGHILDSTERKDRLGRIEKWQLEWKEIVSGQMAEARDLLRARGIGDANIETVILPTREGIARDLLNEISSGGFEIVVMGKKSFHERKPFLMGSHALKVLHSVQSAVLVLVD
ncbi:MAG: universal stress protein [Desulfobacteraceae bacterium]|nr:universal stress protein [Desulfobacteraceae bacterium]